MKQLIAILLCLVAAMASGQTVTIPAQKVPVSGLEAYQTKAEAKKQVDSLAAALRSEFSGSNPGTPAQSDCEHGIELKSVYSVTATGLEYNFYSVGVTRLTETIYGSTGREVFRHTTDPVTRDRIQISYSLRAGNYSLIIQNADCKAVSQPVAFTIPEDAPAEPNPERPGDPSGPATGFYNPGVYNKEEHGILYEWIPSEMVDVQVENGRVRLIAPETKHSWNGTNVCKRFVLGDIFDNKLSDADERALFGDGLALPSGNYGFKILYLNAGNWDAANANMWKMVGYGSPGGEGYSNSAQAETIQLSITDGSRIQGLDANLWRTSWIPQYQVLPYSLRLPENKAFGVTRYLTSVPKDSLLSKLTHLQYIYSWLDNVDKGRTWRNLQALTHEGFQGPDWHIRNAILSKGYILMSEYAENYGNKYGCPPCYDKAEEVYKGIYDRFQREQGVTSPEQTWLGSDYFSALYGGSLSIPFDNRSTTLSTGLSSIRYARSYIYDGTWSESAYFTRGWYTYRNFLSAGYLGNLLAMAGKPAFYSRLYEHEKANLAIPDRKKITYATNAQEGLHMDKVTISGTWYRMPLEGGELLRADGIIHPFQTMLSDSFYALLLGNAYIIWESNVTLNTDPYTFQPSWFGGYDEGKTKWKPTGGSTGVYKPGSYGPPEKKADGQFPEKPMTGDQGAWMGAKLYESIAGRVDQLWYPDYTLNGKTVVAKRGSKGQSLSYQAVQNEGQDNIVKVYEAKLPVVMKGRGQKGDVIIYQNPNAGLTEEQGVEVEGKFFKVVGNRLNVIRL